MTKRCTSRVSAADGLVFHIWRFASAVSARSLMVKIAGTMLALGAGCMLPERAVAQAWPSRPIMLVVPYAPGGNVDIAARVFAKELSSKLGQQVVIENKSGAGGIVGSVAVAKAKPDGYTLLLTAAGPAALNKLLYDTETEFTPIVVTNDVPQILVVSPKLGIVNFARRTALSSDRPHKQATQMKRF